MTVKPVDFFIRRTGALYFNIQLVQKWKQAVMDLMAEYLEWTEEEKVIYQEELETELNDAVNPAEIRQKYRRLPVFFMKNTG